jgi:hypothetical protein
MSLNAWHLAGCPVNGILKDYLVTDRRVYKKAIKAAKRDYKAIKADRLRDSLHNHDAKKFWGIVNNNNSRGHVSRFDNLFYTHGNQFGFCTNGGCNKAIFKN